MTTNQENLVRESFAQVAAIADAAAEIFHGRLLEIDPKTTPLFHGDMREHYRKLMQVPAMAVANLERLALERFRLASRHRRDIVHDLLAKAAIAHALVALHLVPTGGAWRSDLEFIEKQLPQAPRDTPRKMISFNEAMSTPGIL